MILAPSGTAHSSANARSMAAVNAMLQSSSGLNCHNQRTFCMADYSKCKSAQRERVNWRNDCRARYDRAFKACTSRLPGLRGHNGIVPPEVRENYYNRRCGHTRNGSGRCEIEITACNSSKICEQNFGQCVRNQTAELNQRNQHYNEPEAAPQPQYRAPDRAPQRASNRRSPVAPRGFFRPSIKNQCTVPIMVAYAYKDLSGKQRKRGWVKVEAGKTLKLGERTDAKWFYIHPLRGKNLTSLRTGNHKTLVVKNAVFDAPIGAALSGSGTRPAHFDELEFTYREESPVINISSCGNFADNQRIRPVVLRAKTSVAPSKPDVAAKAAPSPAVSPPVGKAECIMLDATRQGTVEATRLLEMQERGMVKLCGVENP